MDIQEKNIYNIRITRGFRNPLGVLERIFCG